MEAGEKYYGNYRAIVNDNNDVELYGRVKVWIPDIMPKVDIKKGLWAWPANNPMGGRNAQNENAKYNGSSFIPELGSWVWVFFEAGNPNRPFYFGGLDIKASKVLPECQLGSEPYRKWVIFKARSGRTIVVSDDEDDCRVEITGKKRLLKEPPAGNTKSVYALDENQTTILLDERVGKEKLLIRTHKGDFINIDIENRTLNVAFKSDILIKTNGGINIEATKDINIKTDSSLKESASGDIHIKGEGNIHLDSAYSINVKGGETTNIESSITSVQSTGGDLKVGGSTLQIAAGLVIGPDYNLGSGDTPNIALQADVAEQSDPIGERD